MPGNDEKSDSAQAFEETLTTQLSSTVFFGPLEEHEYVKRSELEKILIDPVTLELMQEPVTAIDGHTYEKATQQQTQYYSPVLNKRLLKGYAIPNHLAKHIIDAFFQQGSSEGQSEWIKKDDILAYLQCPLSGDLMNGTITPIIMPDGYTYNPSALWSYYRENINVTRLSPGCLPTTKERCLLASGDTFFIIQDKNDFFLSYHCRKEDHMKGCVLVSEADSRKYQHEKSVHDFLQTCSEGEKIDLTHAPDSFIEEMMTLPLRYGGATLKSPASKTMWQADDATCQERVSAQRNFLAKSLLDLCEKQPSRHATPEVQSGYSQQPTK